MSDIKQLLCLQSPRMLPPSESLGISREGVRPSQLLRLFSRNSRHRTHRAADCTFLNSRSDLPMAVCAGGARFVGSVSTGHSSSLLAIMSSTVTQDQTDRLTSKAMLMGTTKAE